jgi:hypothetical protein
MTFEEFADAPELRHAQHLFAVGDIAGFRAMYESQDWRGRSVLTGVAISEDPNLEPRLADLAERYPADPMIGVLRAWHLIILGWEVRTGRRAEHVSPEQFAAFREYLCRAEQILIDLTARDPDHVSAWECRIVTAKGLGLGVPESRRRYAHAMRPGTLSYTAQRQLLENLTPKWGGSWADLHAHAQECLAGAPPGAPNAAIVVDAHVHHWDDLGIEESTGYFDRPDVQAEIREAAGLSVWHLRYRDRYWEWLGLRNLFAFAFSMMEDQPAAAAQFAAMGRFGRDWPWESLAKKDQTGADVFLAHRAWALGEGAGR